MGFVIGLFTLVMVVDCIVLVFLVLIQLPKKEAGAGLAFGGSASDALFGAGSGNVLTKITKYAATIFFVMAVVLSIMQTRYHSRNTSEFERALEQAGRTAPAAGATPGPAAPATTPSAPAATPGVPLTSSNLLSTPAAEAPAAAPSTTTNAAPQK